jgi:hypothetical protein
MLQQWQPSNPHPRLDRPVVPPVQIRQPHLGHRALPRRRPVQLPQTHRHSRLLRRGLQF